MFLAPTSLQVLGQVDKRSGQLLNIDLWSHDRFHDQPSILLWDMLGGSDRRFRTADPLQGNGWCLVPELTECPTSLLRQTRTRLRDGLSVLQ